MLLGATGCAAGNQMKRNDAGFDAETQEQQHKRRGSNCWTIASRLYGKLAELTLPLAWVNRAKPSKRHPASMWAMMAYRSPARLLSGSS